MIGIVGAGPGGLTAAVALRSVGYEVEVLERAPEVRAVGAGITLQVNAMRMLEAVGMAEPMKAHGAVLQHGCIARADGSSLAGMSGLDAWSQPGVCIHRGVLAQVLLDALPAEVVRCGQRVEDVTPDGVVTLLGGETRTYDAVIGADGIHSAVRRGLFGEKPLRYAGYTCWRGIASVRCEALTERWGRGLRFGSVPLPDDQTYWFACENAPAGGTDGTDPIAELLERFADFEPAVHAQIRATEEVMRHDLYDLAPLDRWTRGRGTLLGDAAHAMTPNLGQGAGQAIEDAVVLAHVVQERGLPDALEVYEAQRRPRARRFVDQSWRMGQMAQWENGLATALRNLAMNATPGWVMARSMQDIYGVDVPALSRRPWASPA